jgi:hypothetical protein
MPTGSSALTTWLARLGRGPRFFVRADTPDAVRAFLPPPTGRARLRVFNRHGRLVAVYRPVRGAWILSLDDADYPPRRIPVSAASFGEGV